MAEAAEFEEAGALGRGGGEQADAVVLPGDDGDAVAAEGGEEAWAEIPFAGALFASVGFPEGAEHAIGAEAEVAGGEEDTVLILDEIVLIAPDGDGLKALKAGVPGVHLGRGSVCEKQDALLGRENAGVIGELPVAGDQDPGPLFASVTEEAEEGLLLGVEGQQGLGLEFHEWGKLELVPEFHGETRTELAIEGEEEIVNPIDSGALEEMDFHQEVGFEGEQGGRIIATFADGDPEPGALGAAVAGVEAQMVVFEVPGQEQDLPSEEDAGLGIGGDEVELPTGEDGVGASGGSVTDPGLARAAGEVEEEFAAEVLDVDGFFEADFDVPFSDLLGALGASIAGPELEA